MSDSVISKLNQSTGLTNVLIQVEDWFDSLDLYAFKNWFEGEIVEGPDVDRYWITIILQYDYNKMPDPQGAIRLINHGAKVGYKKMEKECTVDPNKVDVTAVDDKLNDWDQPNPQQNNQRTIPTYPVWLVKVIVPRKFIDVNIDDDISYLKPDASNYVSDDVNDMEGDTNDQE